MSFSYPQQPMPPYGGQGASSAPSPQPPQTQPWASQGPPPPAPPQQSTQAMSDGANDAEGLALLAVTIIIHILLNVYWLYADNHLIHLDEAHHINRAVAYYEALFPLEQASLFERGVAALGVESPYPPLTHLVGAAFIRVLGYSTNTVAFSGSLFLALFLLGVYCFARRGMSGRNAFLAAFVAGFMPIIFGGARYFMPDLLLAALIAWAMYALLKSDRFRQTGWVTCFALFSGLALLTKQTAVVYLFWPALFVLLWGAWSAVYPKKGPGTPLRRTRAAQLVFNIVLAVCIVLGVCSWWYTRHVEYTYTWWSTQRGGETGLLQPGIAARIQFAVPEAMEGAESRIYLDPAISRLHEPEEPVAGVTDSNDVNADVPPEPEETTAEDAETNAVDAENETSLSDDANEDALEDAAALLAPLEAVFEAAAEDNDTPPEPADNGAPENGAEASETSEGEEETPEAVSQEMAPLQPFDLEEDAVNAAAGAASQEPENNSKPEPTAAETAEETEPVTASDEASLLAPLQRDWHVYLFYMVNEAVFFPLALGAFGGLFALLRRRNRNRMTVMLLIWLGGAYVLLTGMFTVRSPQLLYPLMPPVAVLCALALDAVARYRLRRALWVLLVLFFAVHYINLTFFSYGPLKRLELPVYRTHPVVTARGNRGVTVYKDRVNLGHYTLHPPERGEVITEAVFERMLEYEHNRETLDGPVAWYQVVAERPAHLSMDFYARQYRPAPNPLQPHVDEDSVTPRRPFASVKWESRTPEDTLPELAETAYVVLKRDLEGDYGAGLESWAMFLKPHGFESIFNRRFAGYGKATPGYVHVMARKDIPAPDEVTDIFELYELLDRDGKHWLLTDAEREQAEKRYAQLIEAYSRVRPLNDTVNLLGFHVKKAADNWHVLRFVVQARETIEEDAVIWLRARVHEDDREALHDVHAAQETLAWHFTPTPATSTWKPNQALVLTRPVMAAPARYRFQIGIVPPDQTERPETVVETDWVDFADTK